MAIRTKDAGTEFELAPEGTQVARCFKLIDLGTHKDKFGKDKHKVLLGFELPLKTMPDGKPFVVNQQYTLSHNERSILRKDLESWYGKKFRDEDLEETGGFDLGKVIGRPCLLNIVHSDDGKYANINGISALVEGLECPPAVNTPFIYDLEQPDVGFAQLSEKMRKHIMESSEYRAGANKETPKEIDDIDEDLPF